MATTPYVPSITVDNVIDALAAFLTPFVGGDPSIIIRGKTNRVPPPLTGFVELTELIQAPIETPTQTQSADPDVQQASIVGPKRIDVQVDFYGPSAGEWCTSVETVYRTPYAADQFSGGIAPLYCTDGHQAALVMGEEQYEYRWVLTASLQYNPVVVVPQQSALELKLNILEDLP